MDKPNSQEKSTNAFHSLPKSEQFANLQRYRDYRAPKKMFLTETEELAADKNDEFFVSQVIDNNLGNEWMSAINNGHA